MSVVAATTVIFSCNLYALTPEKQAANIFEATGFTGGFIVHLGCADGELTAALGAQENCLVQGLDASGRNVGMARKRLMGDGIYGRVSVDRLAGGHLPYIDNLVNLVVAEDLQGISTREVMRVLAPNGVAYIKTGDRWSKTVKPRPDELDDWTHYLYDASNNAVSKDTAIGPPRRMQWVGSPKYARHHDRMSSVSAAVSADGRVFYIIDEAPHASILLKPQWKLVARDAFNGAILWKRDIPTWHTHLWPLKSGPAQLPRRLICDGPRVYVTLSYDGPMSVLDAATGRTIRLCPQTKATEEAILHDGTLFCLTTKPASIPDYGNPKRFNGGYGSNFWDGSKRKIVAVEAESGKTIWERDSVVLPGTMAADSKAVYLHDGKRVVALNRVDGSQMWHSEPIARSEQIKGFYLPILVVYDDVVLFSGGEKAGTQTGSWYTEGKDTMTALSTKTGKVLWSAYHPPSGYRSPEDLLVADGLVWTGETTSGRVKGTFTGRNPLTGEVKSEFSPDLNVYWFHHRCYRGKATEKYLLMSRTGTEFLDLEQKKWEPHHWVRGACLYGILPANGMLYNPPHPCACYLESKLFGFNAVAPAAKGPRINVQISANQRLIKGPAYREKLEAKPSPGDWPTYRGNSERSGSTNMNIRADIQDSWKTNLGGRLTSPVVAEGKVFAASIDTHTLYALDADSGRVAWRFTAGGRIDSPPTIYEGKALFGSADGRLYCLRASDGALIWSFLAAPTDERHMAFEQIESVWPVHGSVLVRDGAVYCVAGRSMFLDSGLRLYKIEVDSGRILQNRTLDRFEDRTGKEMHEFVSWLNMPPALPDILSTDGKLMYMRSQPFDFDCNRLPLEKMPTSGNADAGAPPPTQKAEFAHLFSPTGFLDDSWWHRTYWMYGSRFVSGWCGYYRAGKAAPAGKILVFDDEAVYGFGRKPQYYRWTTPIEHHLFASRLNPNRGEDETAGPTSIEVAKSQSLNPAGKAITVEAFVKAEKAGGVVLARGGGSLGYTLYLRGAKPVFGVRSSKGFAAAAADTKITGRWVHLAGVLTRDRKIRLYIDGKLAASAEAPGLIDSDPAETMQIGIDEGSLVGDYPAGFAFKGMIDELKIYHSALGEADIAAHAGGNSVADEAKPVLFCTFDKGNAADQSGNSNSATVQGARSVKGRSGKAFWFSGKSQSTSGFMVDHAWTADLPFFARAMLLAGDTIFIAGPPDIVNENEAFRNYDDPAVQKQLARQNAALTGADGAVLLAVSKDDCTKLAEYKIESMPVFDGMAAANGKLYMSATDGRLMCFSQQ